MRSSRWTPWRHWPSRSPTCRTRSTPQRHVDRGPEPPDRDTRPAQHRLSGPRRRSEADELGRCGGCVVLLETADVPRARSMHLLTREPDEVALCQILGHREAECRGDTLAAFGLLERGGV